MPSQEGGYGAFVEEVLAAADEDIDFGHFDNDGPDGIPNSGDDDGVVDYLFVIPRSTPPGFIRGKATGIAGLGLSPKTVRRTVPGISWSVTVEERMYETQDQAAPGDLIRIVQRQGSLLAQGSYAETVGAMAHEFAHSFGLPDLYDLSYNSPAEDSAGIGRWGLMGWGAHGWLGDSGPVGFSAWTLEQLGWIGPDNSRLHELMADTEDHVIEDVFKGGRIYKVHLPTLGSGEDSSAESPGYLLLEHRQRDSHYYNREIPADGVLVWHVRTAHEGNLEERHKMVI